jgi:cytoskeleton-associated protein 5
LLLTDYASITAAVSINTRITRITSEGKASACMDSVMRAVGVAALDKSSAVREAGSALAAEAVKSCGYESAFHALASVHGPEKKAAAEALQKAGGGSMPPSVSAPAALGGVAAGGIAATRGASAASRQAPASRAASAAMEAASAAADDEPLLAMNPSKPQRAKQFRLRPNRFEPPGPEESDALDGYFSSVASPSFYRQLFSKDFRDHVAAADALAAALPDMMPEVRSSLDLVLRWAVIRVCDGNMQSLVRVLEVCRSAFEALVEEEYRMSDYEASAFLPCVVERAGHNQDRVRALHRDLLRLACALHPPSKVIDYVVMGLGSKNNRTKIECCEALAEIADAEGAAAVAVCRAKPAAALAAVLKERDGAARAAALVALEAVWSQLGSEAFWAAVGRLEPREKDMVEEKLKRSTRQAPPLGFKPGAAATAMAVAADSSTPPAAAALQPPKALYPPLRGITPPNPLDTPAPRGAPLPVDTPAPLPPVQQVQIVDDPAFPKRWAACLAGLGSQKMLEAVEATKLLCAEIMVAAGASIVNLPFFWVHSST